MKKPSEETMRKFVAFCDSGRPWYFTLGMSVTDAHCPVCPLVCSR